MNYSSPLVAYSSTLMERQDIDVGNKVILPSSVLGVLSQSSFSSVMIFCLKNIRTGKQTFVGVLEFIADEGTCILPKNVLFNEGVPLIGYLGGRGNFCDSQLVNSKGKTYKNITS